MCKGRTVLLYNSSYFERLYNLAPLTRITCDVVRYIEYLARMFGRRYISLLYFCVLIPGRASGIGVRKNDDHSSLFRYRPFEYNGGL